MAEVSEYKGNKVLVLNPEEKYPFSFGLAKAKLILENIQEIERFYNDHKKPEKE